MKSLILLLLLSAPLLAQEQVHVARIIDGDTFEDSAGRTISLLGVDAPEFDQPFGQNARNYLLLLLLDRDVKLWRTKVDQQGGYHAKVTWRDWDIGVSVVGRGFGQIVPNELDASLYSEYNKRQEVAQQKRAGIWRAGSLVAPATSLSTSVLTPIKKVRKVEPPVYSEPVYRYQASVTDNRVMSSSIFMPSSPYWGGGDQYCAPGGS